MKLLIVVGVRPQFVKAAVVFRSFAEFNLGAAGSCLPQGDRSEELRESFELVLVHTGQHYDDNMSGVFFRELGLPEPGYRLEAGGGSAEAQVQRMKEQMAEVFAREAPEAVLVFGDTNSTVAGAMAAAEAGVPLVHVEAGDRAGLVNNPEEQNRIKVDRMSDLLLCSSKQAEKNLLAEGAGGRIAVTGNLMQDAFLYYSALPWKERKVKLLTGGETEVPEHFYLLTCHRQENSASDEPLREIMTAMEGLPYPTVFPVHPRNRARVLRLQTELAIKQVLPVEPVGYVMSAHLIANAKQVVTDSGGVLSEAFCAGVPYVFVLDLPGLPEKVPFDVNRLAKPKRESVLEKLALPFERRNAQAVWEAGAGERIVKAVVEFLGRK